MWRELSLSFDLNCGECLFHSVSCVMWIPADIFETGMRMRTRITHVLRMLSKTPFLHVSRDKYHGTSGKACEGVCSSDMECAVALEASPEKRNTAGYLEVDGVLFKCRNVAFPKLY